MKKQLPALLFSIVLAISASSPAQYQESSQGSSRGRVGPHTSAPAQNPFSLDTSWAKSGLEDGLSSGLVVGGGPPPHRHSHQPHAHHGRELVCETRQSLNSQGQYKERRVCHLRRG
jgi:hypothetical protein